MSALRGNATEGDDPAVQHQAGAILRRLHDAVPPEPWPEYAAEKLELLDRLMARAPGVVAPDAFDFARSELRALESVHGPMRVPCHLDYTPRNWLVDGDRLRVIDFDGAALEVWVNDLARISHWPWRERPDLRDAFLDGYGRQPSDDDLAVLAAGSACDAIQTIIWAREHGQAVFESDLRAALDELRRRRPF